MKDVFPNSIHGYCALHLKSNIKQAFSKFCEDFFWALVYVETNSSSFCIFFHIEFMICSAFYHTPRMKTSIKLLKAVKILSQSYTLELSLNFIQTSSNQINHVTCLISKHLSVRISMLKNSLRWKRYTVCVGNLNHCRSIVIVCLWRFHILVHTLLIC